MTSLQVKGVEILNTHLAARAVTVQYAGLDLSSTS